MKGTIGVYGGVGFLIFAVLIGLGVLKIQSAAALDDATTSEIAVDVSPVDVAASPSDATTTAVAAPSPIDSTSTLVAPTAIATSSPTDATSTPPATTPSTPTIASSTATTASQFKLVHIRGMVYTDYFSDGNQLIPYPGDPNIDSRLNQPNAQNPTHPGLRWVSTSGTYAYDTPSGTLEINDYAVQSDGTYIVHLPSSQYTDATSSVMLPDRTVTGVTLPSGQ